MKNLLNMDCHTITEDFDVFQYKNCKHTKQILKVLKELHKSRKK